MEISNSVFVLKVYALLVAVLLATEVHTQPQKFNTEIQQVSLNIVFIDFWIQNASFRYEIVIISMHFCTRIFVFTLVDNDAIYGFNNNESCCSCWFLIK